jgi:hypothetical protein
MAVFTVDLDLIASSFLAVPIAEESADTEAEKPDG